jgi:AraC family transcriptional regulator of adaptative response / DNA-3-methyladenine glycosylase II
LNEDEFAERFGLSARHLRRLFTEQIGKTPKRLVFENRLARAKSLIMGTTCPMSEIAFNSGFTSVRRFNDAIWDEFAKSPSELRKSKSKSINKEYRL